LSRKFGRSSGKISGIRLFDTFKEILTFVIWTMDEIQLIKLCLKLAKFEW